MPTPSERSVFRFLPRLLAALSALVLVSGCRDGRFSGSTTSVVSSPTPRTTTTASAESSNPKSTLLTPLPNADKVLGQIEVGRRDPFAPLPPVRSELRVVNLPKDFRFKGVMVSGGTPLALIDFQGIGGAVRIGDLGGKTTDLLPDSWRVEAVDIYMGRLTLSTSTRNRSSRITLEL